MARLSDEKSRLASERLRLIISKSPGGYTKNRKRLAKKLGVSERSVERYLAKSGANRRFIRKPEMKQKIDREFNYRKNRYPSFYYGSQASIILRRGDKFNVTKYSVPFIGDNQNNVKGIFMENAPDRDANSIWLKDVKLPRVYIEGGGPKRGLIFERIALNIRYNSGVIDYGDTRNLPLGGDDGKGAGEYAGNTFGFVDDETLGVKGRSDDLAIQGNRMFLEALEQVGSSAEWILTIFDPQMALDNYGGGNQYLDVGIVIRNRRPNVNLSKTKDGKTITDYSWEDRKL